ncbi:MAG: aspartate 1-decarboxylase [Verrucomicrobia bacterium]|nr:aspartate 1-decarboxylase [Verrucomicrobiota bacterium]MBU1733926.1 aspartate 1-decarboxylase [Verrucomicrobiota bacterium]MBU1857280.1 aspartate 1-decarboxylase [Verrucomicrobiota bacterium]
MQREMLKSKIHRVRITRVALDYEGSLSCDPRLLKAADILPGEKVLVANLRNGKRFETYAIEGRQGEICLNGAAARLGRVGDIVIVMAFAHMDRHEAQTRHPKVVLVDKQNRIRKGKAKYASLRI